MGLPETTRRSGLGNLADRAGELGGTFHAGPAEGGGTNLDWRVPLPAGRADQLHWSIPEPAASGGTGQDTYPAFERMAAELETRIGFLLAMIGAAPAPASIQEV